MKYHEANAQETTSCSQKHHCQHLEPHSLASTLDLLPRVTANVSFTEITPCSLIGRTHRLTVECHSASEREAGGSLVFSGVGWP